MVTLLLFALTSSLLLCPDSAFASYEEQHTEVPKTSTPSLTQDSHPLSAPNASLTTQEKKAQVSKKKPNKHRKKKRVKQRNKKASQKAAKAKSQEHSPQTDHAAISAALDQARTKQSLSPQEISTPVLAADFAPRPLKERYTLVPGSFLRQLRAFCGQAGWQLIWEAKRDLEISSTASYIAPFEDALRVIFADLARSGQAFRVTLYKANSVVEVRDD